MKEPDGDLWRLKHILKALEKIESFSSSCNSFEEFFEDEKTQASVKYELVVIGEATNRLTEQVRTLSAGAQWRAIIGMRNYLAHEYFAVDLNTVWETVQRDVPVFKSAIVGLINKLKENK